MIRAFLLLLAALLLTTNAARAETFTSRCACAPAPFDSRWRSADAIFSGTILNIEVQQDRVEHANAELPVKVTVSVDEGFKGPKKGMTFYFFSNMNVATCMGMKFEKGVSYLFYAYMRRPETKEAWSFYDFPSDTYDVGGTCGGTLPLTDKTAADELAQLREKDPVTKTTSPVINNELGFLPAKPAAGD